MAQFLPEFLLVLVVALAVVLVFARLRQPTLLGFLASGLFIGPHGLGLIGDAQRVELLAEVGVVLLLFSIGLDFSFEKLRRMAREVFAGGSVQVGLSVCVVAAVALGTGLSLPQGLLWGFLLAMSSTAVVLRVLTDEGLLGTAQGRLSLGILLFQDLCIVPMMVVLPLLAGLEGGSPWALLLRLGLAAGFFVLLVLGARFFIPRILQVFVRSGRRELFLLVLVALCLATAWATAEAGLTMALGAFLAGMAVAESEFSYQALADVLPLRDSLSAFFFVSVGMLLDPKALLAWPLAVLVFALAVVLLKVGGVVAAAAAFGFGPRVGLQAGLMLAQVGEFSFLLAAAGRGLGLLSSDQEQLFLATAVLTMAATPLVGFPVARKLARGAQGLDGSAPPAEETSLWDHIILAGFGGGGQVLGRIFRQAQVPFCVVDYALPAVHGAEIEGIPYIFGDVTRPEILQAAGIARARLLILTVGDPEATRAAVRLARHLRADLPILVATHFVSEIDELAGLGATQVVAYELEATVTLFVRALEFYHIPRHIVAAQAAVVRSGGYEVLRAGSLGGRSLARLPELLAAGTVEVVRLPAGSPAVGKSLAELRLREETGASVLGVVRGQKQKPNPPANFQLASDDLVILFGSHAEVDRALSLLAPHEQGESSPG